MSGGVDSSVAAYLLKKEGFDVHGFTLRMWSEDGRCCSRDDIEAAVTVSRKLGISHAIVDIRKEFEEKVVAYFIDEYKNGRTPNPCGVCNQMIRFGSFWEQIDKFGAEYLATGHYAKIVSESGELYLSRAKDKKKSQEYFLSLVSKNHLKRILFPLAELAKTDVRNIAQENDLPVIHRESQDICFIPDGYTGGFLYKRLGKNSGDIVDMDDRILGRHNGVWCYTIGQRKGLGLSQSTPLYVVSIDVKRNLLIVGPKNALSGKRFKLSRINRFTERNLSTLDLTAKIRYATPEIPCRFENNIVTLSRSVDAITPGQMGVVYTEGKVMLAGLIETPIQV